MHSLPAKPEGITTPPIDGLLTVTGSKYELVSIAAQLARQINSYYAQLQEDLLENVGPLVTPGTNEKPLSIALREINEGKVVGRQPTEEDLAAALAAQEAERDILGAGAPGFDAAPSFDTGTEQG